MDGISSYLISVVVLSIGLFYLVYILYGRITHKPLIGGYKPGTAEYEGFRKIAYSNKYLVIAVLVVCFFTLSVVFDVRRVLQSDSSRIALIVIPLIIVFAFVILIPLLTKILTNKK